MEVWGGRGHTSHGHTAGAKDFGRSTMKLAKTPSNSHDEVIITVCSASFMNFMTNFNYFFGQV